MKNMIVEIDGVPTLRVADPAALSEYELIDVRRSEEFIGELGHIKGSRLVTLGEELDVFLQRANKNKKILFICRSGARSGKATLQAISLGYEQVYNMEGGMIYWNEQKFPITKELL